MENKDEKKIQKFTALYMSLGMLFGVSAGMVFGMLLFQNNLAIGTALGISMGMCVGLAIGAAKDKRLSENMMKISRIEDDGATSDKIIYVIDKEGNEKEYRVTENVLQQGKFAVEDRVAEEKNGILVSLESK